MNEDDWTDWYEQIEFIELPDDWNIDLYLEDRAAMPIDPRPWNELPTLSDFLGD